MVFTLARSARRIALVRRFRLGTSRVALAASLLPVSALAVHAQASGQVTMIPTPERVSPQRALLDSAAKNLERASRTEKDLMQRNDLVRQAQMIRKRLAEGDFQTGHRILLFVAGDSSLTDTFTVRAEQKLQLPNLPEISLAGVLDSELQGYLETQLAKYIRNPSVRAQALLRVSVSGDVGKPGFYSVPVYTPVSDVIMGAGGPSSTADMNKTELRRGSAVVVDRGGIQMAIRKELTMSDVGARPGDELFVPAKPSGSRWAKIAAIATSISAIAWSLIWLGGRR